MPRILSDSAYATRRVVREKMTCCTVGLLLMDCCIYISFAISLGLVGMLLFRYGFFSTFFGVFGGDFSCLYICCFG